MSKEEELVHAFREGRLSRRAFVRQLVEGGMEMPAALAYADVLVPAPVAPGATGSEMSAGTTAEGVPVEIPARPIQVDDLEINFVGDGYIVYQAARDRVHTLNHTAAVVLELCTGENDEAEIARLLQQVYELPEPPDEETRQCLESFFDEGLIR